MKKLNWKLPQLSANQEAGQGFIKFAAYAIVIAVVGYADIAFIQIMSKHFLGGLFGVLSMIGAVATAASIIALLFGKANWFRPGKQLKFAYIFTAAEVIVSLANVLLSFELTSNQPLDQLMSIWYNFTAATPFVALVGWILILHFDQSQQDRHEQLEFEEKANKLKREQEQIQLLAQLEHEQEIFEAQMSLSETYLQHETAYMQQFVNSPQLQERLQAGAMKRAMETFSKLTGLPFVAGLMQSTYQPQQPPALPQPPVQQLPQSNIMSSQPSVSTPPTEHIDTARWEAMLREMAEGMKARMTLFEREAVRQQVIQEYSQQQPPQNPLQSPQLDTQASQPGTNGTNGHQSNKSQA